MTRTTIALTLFAFIFAPAVRTIADDDAPDKKIEAAEEPVDLEELGAKLKAAVAAGKLTEAEAKAKWAELTKQSEARKGRRQPEGDDLEGVWKRLEAAVKAGKLTQEQAEAKMIAIKRSADKKGKAAKQPVDRKGLDARLEAAVKAGKLTREEADAKRAVLKRRLEASRQRQPFLPLDAGAVDETQPARGFTTPPAAVSREGSASTLIFGWAANATHRFMDSTHQGKPREIRAVSFRLDQREHDAIGRTWSNVILRVAHGDWKSIQYNKSEEYTLTDDPVKVFDREWSFPAVTGRPPLTPASWGGLQNSLTFRFSKPWQYNGRDAIFLEFEFSGGTAHNGKPWVGQNPKGFEYFLDSMPEDGGWREARAAGAISYEASIVPAATSYAATSNPTDMSAWTAAAKGMPFIHYHD